MLWLHNQSEEYSIWVSPSAAGSLKFCSQTADGCRLVSCYSHIKRLGFISYHRPSHRFSFGPHYCKPRVHHLVQLCSFQLFQCLLFAETLYTFTWFHKQSLVVLFLYIMNSWQVNAVCSLKHIAALATVKPPNDFKFLKESKLHVSSCQQYLVHSSRDLVRAL
jgi:hypothetical protein